MQTHAKLGNTTESRKWARTCLDMPSKNTDVIPRCNNTAVDVHEAGGMCPGYSLEHIKRISPSSSAGSRVAYGGTKAGVLNIYGMVCKPVPFLERARFYHLTTPPIIWWQRYVLSTYSCQIHVPRQRLDNNSGGIGDCLYTPTRHTEATPKPYSLANIRRCLRIFSFRLVQPGTIRQKLEWQALTAQSQCRLASSVSSATFKLVAIYTQDGYHYTINHPCQRRPLLWWWGLTKWPTDSRSRLPRRVKAHWLPRSQRLTITGDGDRVVDVMSFNTLCMQVYF